ncbi:Maf family protein [Algivirga pacifica]|uniref:dTTP/UTP pyrophosphatase n=1 Tax=Algivirga pacifica TaxID=1162670 RepID=A0ABP9D5T4_9BACT
MNLIVSKKIILASKSPRRQQLLEQMGLSFEVRTKEVEEIFPEEIEAADVAAYLASLKGKAFEGTLVEEELLITSDTVVVNDGKVLGKPADEQEALQMIAGMSGKKHQVYTAVCLATADHQEVFTDCTEVVFRSLSKEEIAYYVSTYKPYDKAGAYGIQEWIGLIGIERIEGSYFNVMGLPTEKLYTYLKPYISYEK